MVIALVCGVANRYATWQSLNPEMELTLYSLERGSQGRKRKQIIQIGGKETAEQALGFQLG